MRIINIQNFVMSKRSAETNEKFERSMSRKEKIQDILDMQNRSGNYVPEYKGDVEKIYRTIISEIIQKMYYYAKRDFFDLDGNLPLHWDEYLLDFKRLSVGVYEFLESLDVYDKTDIILAGIKARHDDFVWLDGKNFAIRNHRIRYVPFELLPVALTLHGYTSSKSIFDQIGLNVDENMIEKEFLARKDEYYKVKGIDDLVSLMRFFNNILDHYAPAKGFAHLLKKKSIAMSLASEVFYFED